MYKPLIFGYHVLYVITLFVTKCARHSFLYGSLSNKLRRVVNASLMATSGEYAVVRFREKQMKECDMCPYRKPTPVGWSSRPRQTSKGGSRNSAKKLSVSYARSSVPIYRDYNKRLSTDCLPKTQAPANLKKERIGAETCPVLVS